MPIHFPDNALAGRAKQRGFRDQGEDETIDAYREAFADFMVNVDAVEASEIRSGVPHDMWDTDMQREFLRSLRG